MSGAVAHYRYKIHGNGPALWPEHKPLAEILLRKAVTPLPIWLCTWQGTPVNPGGAIFRREWWAAANRYDAGDVGVRNQVVARWISFDTANKKDDEGTPEGQGHAYTAMTVAELSADYRLLVREVWRDKLEFPDLPERIAYHAARHYPDGKLRAVLIEDKASGTSAYQTLMASAEPWLQAILVAFQPSGDKEERANQAAVWCRNDTVLLPFPSEHAPWLHTFEDELFAFPNSTFKDQVDSFSQLVIYVENLLSQGYQLRLQQDISQAGLDIHDPAEARRRLIAVQRYR